MLVAQQVVQRRLVWSESVSCAACGYRHEADDHGYPPSEYREAIRRSRGEWTVSVRPDSDRVRVAAVLRHALGLQPGDALAAARSACSAAPGWWRGTECEAAWLASLLAEGGVVAQRDVLAAPEAPAGPEETAGGGPVDVRWHDTGE